MFNYLLIVIALLTLSCSGTVKEEKPATTAEPAKEAPKPAKEAAPTTVIPKEHKNQLAPLSIAVSMEKATG